MELNGCSQILQRQLLQELSGLREEEQLCSGLQTSGKGGWWAVGVLHWLRWVCLDWVCWLALHCWLCDCVPWKVPALV